MPEATFISEGDEIDYTPVADVQSGQVIVQGDLVAVAKAPIAANTRGSLSTRGVFDFNKSSGAGPFTVGQLLYWNDTTNLVDSSPTGNKVIGKVVVAANPGTTVCRVRLSQ